MKNVALARDRGLSQVAERQMRAWALGLNPQSQSEVQESPTLVRQLIQPYVAISRETGTNAAELGRLIGDKLNWKVLGSELLDFMAENNHWSRLSLDFVDETTASWFHEMFGKWLDKQLVSQAEYVSRLGRIMMLAAQHESHVFIGRAAQFILPRESGIAVRIIAPRKQRVEQIMSERQLNRHDAEAYVDEKDRGRRDFIKRYFQHDTADPSLYDLVFNLQYMSLEDAAELIAIHCRQRFAAR